MLCLGSLKSGRPLLWIMTRHVQVCVRTWVIAGYGTSTRVHPLCMCCWYAYVPGVGRGGGGGQEKMLVCCFHFFARSAGNGRRDYVYLAVMHSVHCCDCLFSQGCCVLAHSRWGRNKTVRRRSCRCQRVRSCRTIIIVVVSNGRCTHCDAEWIFETCAVGVT